MRTRIVWLRRLLYVVLSVSPVFFLIRCTLSPNKVGMRIGVDTEALKARLKGTQLEHLSCFFVSISGPGVTFDYGALDFRDRDPECMKLNRTSNLATLDDLRDRGIRMSTAAGSSRLIRIMGASTSIKDCTGRPLKDLFDRKTPFIYEVARKEVDLYTDKRVEITELNDLSQANDIVAPCDNTGGIGGGISGNNHASAGYLAVALQTSRATVTRMFDISSSLTPQATAIPDVVHDNPSNMRYFVQPNARSFYLFSDTGTRDASGRRFNISDGTVTSPDEWVMNLGTSLYMDFTVDSRFTYTAGQITIHQFQTNDQGVVTPIDPSSCGTTYPAFVIKGSRFYEFGNGIANFANVPANGNLCGQLITNGESPGPFSGFAKRAVVASNGLIYVLSTTGESNESTLQAFNPDGNGRWIGPVAPAAIINTAATNDLVIDPQSKFAYVGAVGPGKVLVYAINPVNGSVGLTPTSEATIGAVSNLTADPLGRGFFGVEARTTLRAYSVSPAGIATEVIVNDIPELTNGQIRAAQTIPVFN